MTIYGYELSIHRLIQLIDHCFLGDCGAWDGLQTGEFIVLGDHYMVLIMGTVIRGCGLGVIRIMSQWRIDAIVRYILLMFSDLVSEVNAAADPNTK